MSDNAFAALKEANTPSILTYLAVKATEPILKHSPLEDLTKAIWPTQYIVFAKWKDGAFREHSVTDAVTHALEEDPVGPSLFERLLIVTDAIPLLEEHLRSQQRLLRQVRDELRQRQPGWKISTAPKSACHPSS